MVRSVPIEGCHVNKKVRHFENNLWFIINLYKDKSNIFVLKFKEYISKVIMKIT